MISMGALGGAACTDAERRTAYVEGLVGGRHHMKHLTNLHSVGHSHDGAPSAELWKHLADGIIETHATLRERAL